MNRHCKSSAERVGKSLKPLIFFDASQVDSVGNEEISFHSLVTFISVNDNSSLDARLHGRRRNGLNKNVVSRRRRGVHLERKKINFVHFIFFFCFNFFTLFYQNLPFRRTISHISMPGTGGGVCLFFLKKEI